MIIKNVNAPREKLYLFMYPNYTTYNYFKNENENQNMSNSTFANNISDNSHNKRMNETKYIRDKFFKALQKICSKNPFRIM